MTESFCPNEGMRDGLPALLHGTLSPADEARVREHLSECTACAEELAFLETTRRVLVAKGPQVNTAAIVAALTAPSLKVVRGRADARPGNWMSRRYLAAAASLLIIGSLAHPSVRQFLVGGPAVVTGDSIADLAASSMDAAGLALSGGLGDLSADDLATLLAELEVVEATIASEPQTMRAPLVDTPEGP